MFVKMEDVALFSFKIIFVDKNQSTESTDFFNKKYFPKGK